MLLEKVHLMNQSAGNSTKLLQDAYAGTDINTCQLHPLQ